jgi:hypothetical protein
MRMINFTEQLTAPGSFWTLVVHCQRSKDDSNLSIQKVHSKDWYFYHLSFRHCTWRYIWRVMK